MRLEIRCFSVVTLARHLCVPTLACQCHYNCHFCCRGNPECEGFGKAFP